MTNARQAAGALAITMAVFSPDAAKSQQSNGSTSFATPVVLKSARSTDMPAPTPGPQAAPLFDTKFSAGITSDYNYRGYTLSNHKPSVFGTAELDYGILFASVNAASVQMPNLSHFQMTDTLGIRPAFGPVTVETGVAYYSYPGGASDPSYSEFYVAPSYAATSRLLVGLKLYYAPDYYRMGVWENYNSIAAKYDVGSGLTISAELGHQSKRRPGRSGGTSTFDAAFGVLAREHADALFIQADGFYGSRRVQLATLAMRERMPASNVSREMVEAGLLMSYGTNIADMFRQVGIYTGSILKGTKPVDLPVIQSTKFEFVINARTAKALGIELSPLLLTRADEVIE